MTRVDGYLSRLASSVWPGAVVYCEGDMPRESWRLERPQMPPLGLGINFTSARQAIDALIDAQKGTAR